MRQRGVTLVELLVSLSLIVVGSVFVLSVFPRLASAGYKSRDRWRAAELAYSWSNVRQRARPYGSFQEGFTLSNEREETESQFGRTRTTRYTGITEITGMYDDLRRVKVTVTWEDFTGPQRLVLETVQCLPNP